MRIGQLARRLGISPSDLLSYLGNHNIDSEAGTNSRLSREDVVKVINHFAPEKLSEILSTPAEEQVVVEPVQPVEVIEEEVVFEPVAEETVEQPTETEDTQKTDEAPVEVIRVAKVELQGLKVLGKIDLPGKKKPEVPTTEQPAEESTQPAPRKEYTKRTDRREQRREWKNPIEAKRQQEALEAERKKQEQIERQKEKRASHYYNKVKSVPTKAVRRIEEQTVVEDIEAKEQPKGLIGKFLRWLKS